MEVYLSKANAAFLVLITHGMAVDKDSEMFKNNYTSQFIASLHSKQLIVICYLQSYLNKAQSTIQ